MHTHEICPPLLTHPGWHLLTHTCTRSHTHRDRCHTLERWAAIQSTWGARGYGALLKGTSAVTRKWTATPPTVSSPIFERWKNRGSNRQSSGYWTTHSHHWAKAFQGQKTYIIPPLSSRFAQEPLSSWTCPENLQRDATRRHPNQMPCCKAFSQLLFRTFSEA